MRLHRCLPALALLIFSPARADESAVSKAPADGREIGEKASCCPGERRTTCPKVKTASPAARNAPQGGKTQAPAPGASSIVISIDPETGRTRPATPEEINRLMARRAPAATAQPVVVTLPDGTEMMRLDERFHHFASIRLTPNGKIESACVHGPDEAEAFAKGATQSPHAGEK